jgi:predicted metal-binding protein
MLKSYPATWKGHLVLACQKCQKKLKGNDELAALAKLKKSVKRHNKRHPDAPIHLVRVPCMDLCPKDAVTVVLPQQPGRLSILRSEADIDQLYAGLEAVHQDIPNGES